MNVRATIEAVFEEELTSFLGRLRYDLYSYPSCLTKDMTVSMGLRPMFLYPRCGRSVL